MSVENFDLLINLDLDKDVYATLVKDLVNRGFIAPSSSDLSKLSHIASELQGKKIRLVALFSRNEYPDSEALSIAHAMIRRGEGQLESYQLTQAIQEVALVDCGMEPTAPLSNYQVLSSYLETYANSLPENASGSVHTLTYEENLNSDTMSFHDTQSDEFLNLMLGHARHTLRALNTNFGQGELVDVPE